MPSAIANPRSFWAGLLFVAIAGFVLLTARHYPMGTATQMGPGYFPTLLAVLLGGLGLIAMFQGVRAAHVVTIGAWPLVPGAFVIAGVLGFAALVDERGLVAAIAVLVGLGCYERLLKRPFEVLAILIVLLALAWVVFIYAIEIPIDFW